MSKAVAPAAAAASASQQWLPFACLAHYELASDVVNTSDCERCSSPPECDLSEEATPELFQFWRPNSTSPPANTNMFLAKLMHAFIP